jgi:hypothetical protein
MGYLDSFERGYVEAALKFSGDYPLDKYYNVDDISSGCLEKMLSDCNAFQIENASTIDAASTRDRNENEKRRRAGADFFLTRNRHGAGFWDGDWSEPQATTLTNAAHRFGEFELYETDDKAVDCYPSPNPLFNGSSDAVILGLGVALLGAVGFAIYQYKQAQAAQALTNAYQTQAQLTLTQSLQADPFATQTTAATPAGQ